MSVSILLLVIVFLLGVLSSVVVVFLFGVAFLFGVELLLVVSVYGVLRITTASTHFSFILYLYVYSFVITCVESNMVSSISPSSSIRSATSDTYSALPSYLL